MTGTPLGCRCGRHLGQVLAPVGRESLDTLTGQGLCRLGPDGTRLIPWAGNGAQGAPRDRHRLGLLAEPDPQLGPCHQLIDNDHIQECLSSRAAARWDQ